VKILYLSIGTGIIGGGRCNESSAQQEYALMSGSSTYKKAWAMVFVNNRILRGN
jgi:hypothetical protein